MKIQKITLLVVVTILAVGLNANAGLVNLTTAGADGWANGAHFIQDNFEKATGTGVFDPFVRVQGNDSEAGYNTDGDVEFETKQGSWTHAIQLSEIPVCEGDFYDFKLDINEASSESKLSLDVLKIYLLDAGDVTDYVTNIAPLTPAYDMDFGPDGESTVLLDYSIGSGSGSGDMTACIPVSVLGTDGSKYVYLYSEFGLYTETDEGWTSSDGFEEWGVIVPEPATMILLGLGSIVLGKCK